MSLSRTASVGKATALASLALLGLAAAPTHAQTFNFTLSQYASPNFTNANGTHNFTEFANTSTFTVTGSAVTTFNLTTRVEATFTVSPTNATPPGVFTGTASSLLTITGLGSQTLTDAYTLDGTTAARFPSFLGGTPLTFALAGGTQQLVITPIASTTFERVTAQIVPVPPAAVPEPSQTAALGLGVLGVSALMLKARKRKSIQA